MFSDKFFHPDHIIPASKLVSALMKCTHHMIAKPLMEMHAVLGQIFIIYLRIAYTGIDI